MTDFFDEVVAVEDEMAAMQQMRRGNVFGAMLDMDAAEDAQQGDLGGAFVDSFLANL
jgi:hypothetical protein